MPRLRYSSLLVALLLSTCLLSDQAATAREVERPEEIKSKREVVYDDATYVELERLWKEYNDAYPSEYAYANWMYAARYAKDADYPKLLDKGLEKYPANPTLLYLKGIAHLGLECDPEGQKYLERAIAFDPGFIDPWFALVGNYMSARQEERLDMALRTILESGYIKDVVMDYNYNVLVGLDENAILVTNGDNDTYPAWILTRIADVRPDVTIVNRSLLNTDWYPMYLLEHDFPRFIDKPELEHLRQGILEDMEKSKSSPPPGGLFGDTLILRIIASAGRAGRPVYFAKTVYVTDRLKAPYEAGKDLGLATLVTPSQTSYPVLLKKTYSTWTDSFRTGGLQSWWLKGAPESDAGRSMVTTYAFCIAGSLPRIKADAPEMRAPLFRWYTKYVDGLLSADYRSKVANAWCCAASDVADVDAWCKKQGLTCEQGR